MKIPFTVSLFVLVLCTVAYTSLSIKTVKASEAILQTDNQETARWQEDARPPIDAVTAIQVDNAPGYCPSEGGVSNYENISNIALTPNADGTFHMKVDVFIENPSGCTTGKPCPEYDPSPEYLNAWIDWNGDKVWDSSERVMDEELTGYSSINYSGAMSAVAQVTPPATATDATWLRANLGWQFDPNNACELAWFYGNVVDQPLILSPPKIKEIKITGSVDPKHPMTTHDVKAEVILENDAEYDITKVRWSGHLKKKKEGDGNPYTYKPEAGSHGKKTIKVTVDYKHKKTGATGEVSEERMFKLFFEKEGDDNDDGDPNWFDYWGKDGAVPELNGPNIVYDQKSQKGTGDYGSWNPTTRIVTLGADAAEIHYPYPYNIVVPSSENCPGGNFGGAQGIDTVTEIIVHERMHEELWDNWNINGIWSIGTTADSDDPTPNNKWNPGLLGDLLPDTYETNVTGTDPKDLDSCDLQRHKRDDGYADYGDNEFVSILAGDGRKGVDEKDWANPGKQTKPPFLAIAYAALALPMTTSGPAHGSATGDMPKTLFPGRIELTGNYTDAVIDSDGDGVNESLRIGVEINVIKADTYHVGGDLSNGSGEKIVWAAQRAIDLPVGVQQVFLDFDGQPFYNSQLNGPYILSWIEIKRADDHAYTMDIAKDAHTTSAYKADSFVPPPVTFSNSYAETTEDVDDDGRFDALAIDVGVQVHEPGNYTMTGWLRDSNGNSVSGANATATFTSSGMYKLRFDSEDILWHRADGPYILQNVDIRDENQDRVNFRTTAYTTTTAYDVNQFSGSEAGRIDASSFMEEGLDFDGDQLFDFLRTTFSVNINEAGQYEFTAILHNNGRKSIDLISKKASLDVGLHSISLDFPGGEIRNSGEDGPYEIQFVSLEDGSGTVDLISSAIKTRAYTHTAFSPPMITLLGNYTEKVEDTNRDNINDQLSIGIEILPGNDGVVTAQGRLLDSNGNQIKEWARIKQEVTAGTVQTITLPFSAAQILSHGVDGPYQFRNLLVYHAADPNQAISILDPSYITQPYDHATLEPKNIPGPPASLKINVGPSTLTADGVSKSLITVTVMDEKGNPIPNQTVKISTTRGSFDVSSLTTDISGTVVAEITAPTQIGSGTITIQAGNVTKNATISFVAGAPASLTLTIAPATLIAGSSDSALITATLLDAFGNPIANKQVNFTTSLGTIANSTKTDNDGKATASIIALSGSGSATITASIGEITGTETVEFTAGTPSTATLSASSEIIVADGSSTSTISVEIQDAFGHALPGQEVQFTTTGGTIESPVMTDQNGVATTTLTSSTTVGTVKISASIGNISAEFNIEFSEVGGQRENLQIFLPLVSR